MLSVPPYYLPDSLDVDFVQSPGNLIFKVVLIIQRVSRERHLFRQVGKIMYTLSLLKNLKCLLACKGSKKWYGKEAYLTGFTAVFL